MTRVLLVPDLPLERWPSMDRYAHRLHDRLEGGDPGFEVRLAASIGDLTRDLGNGRSSGGYPRWWAQDVDPTKFVLPGPLHEPQRYVARYFLYPWWLRREAKRAQLVHILDHSYAHMVTRVHRRPAVVTVHDLMPVIILRSPTDGWREGVRNRFLRGTLKALRLAGAYIVGTEWLKRELATWLGDDRRISVVPFARSTPTGTTLMRRSSPSHVASSRFSHSVPTMYDRASRSAFSVPRRNRFRTPSRQPSVGERRMMTGIRSCTVTIAGRCCTRVTMCA